jgi:hypothetical protein
VILATARVPGTLKEERTTASGEATAAQETTGTTRDANNRDARTDGNTTNSKDFNQRRDTSNTRELTTVATSTTSETQTRWKHQ